MGNRNNGYERLDTVAEKYRIESLNAICLLGLVLVGSSALARFIYFREIDSNIVTLFALALSVLVLRLYVNLSRNVAKASLIMNLLFFLGVPVRIYQTGGLSSPVWFLYAFHCAFVFVVNGRAQGLFLVAWSCASIATFAALEAFGAIAHSPFHENLFNRGFAVFICVAITVLPIFILFKEKSALEARLRKVEKRNSSYIITRKLFLKTRAPLLKALEGVEQVDSSSGGQALERLEKSLDELDMVVKGMSKAADEGVLADTDTGYQGEAFERFH